MINPVKWYSYSKGLDLPSTSTVLRTEYEYENTGIPKMMNRNVGNDEA